MFLLALIVLESQLLKLIRHAVSANTQVIKINPFFIFFSYCYCLLFDGHR
jgi:hypothetical protein